MDLGRCTRCIFITWGLLIIVCQTTRSNTHYGSVGASASEKFDLMVSEQFLPRSYSHRVLLLTVLCTLCLALLSCAGKLQLRSLCPLSLFLSLILRLLFVLLLLLWLVDTSDSESWRLCSAHAEHCVAPSARGDSSSGGTDLSAWTRLCRLSVQELWVGQRSAMHSALLGQCGVLIGTS